MGSCHGRAAAKWWEETTAPHVLSSPWVRFPFGKVLRGAFMVATFMVWLDATFLRSGTVSYLDPYTTDSNIQPLALILVWYFWVASLWFFFQSNWESLSGSLLFALGVTISIWTMCFEEYWVATSLGTNYVLVLLLNCSVHPVTILPNNIFGVLWAIYMSTKTDHMFFDPAHLPLEVYSLSSAWICFVAFTRNFTLRVETYFALMEATEPTEQQRATSDRSDIADPFRRSLGAYCLVLGGRGEQLVLLGLGALDRKAAGPRWTLSLLEESFADMHHGSTLSWTCVHFFGAFLAQILRGRRGNGTVWLFARHYAFTWLDCSFANGWSSRQSHVLFLCSKLVRFWPLPAIVFSADASALWHSSLHLFACDFDFCGHQPHPFSCWDRPCDWPPLLHCSLLPSDGELCHGLFYAQSRSGRSSTRARGAQHSCEFHATRAAVKKSIGIDSQFLSHWLHRMDAGKVYPRTPQIHPNSS